MLLYIFRSESVALSTKTGGNYVPHQTRQKPAGRPPATPRGHARRLRVCPATLRRHGQGGVRWAVGPVFGVRGSRDRKPRKPHTPRKAPTHPRDVTQSPPRPLKGDSGRFRLLYGATATTAPGPCENNPHAPMSHGPAMVRHGPATARHSPATAQSGPSHSPAAVQPRPGHGPAMDQPWTSHSPTMVQPRTSHRPAADQPRFSHSPAARFSHGPAADQPRPFPGLRGV